MKPPAPLLRCLSTLLTAALLLTPVLAAGPSSAAVPRPPHRYTAKIEPLARYQAQSKCSPFAKAGTTAFANLLLRTYPRSRSLGIVRSCSVGGKSEHKEGRAFDWGVSVYNKRDRRSVKALMTWLLKTDRFGNKHAMARRLGIQYMIWNRRIWGSYAAGSGWRRYTGANPHTDHVHFSLSWAGARKTSSFWRPRGFTAPPPAPNRPTRPTPEPDHPAPKPGTTPGSKPRGKTIPEPRPPRSLKAGPVLRDERVALVAKRRAGVVTKGALQRGRRYLVEVSGSYRYEKAAGSRADAECSAARGWGWWRDRSVRRDRGYDDHLDVYIDGHDLSGESDSGQYCDTGSHTYRSVYVPARTGRVPLRIWDPTKYQDNRGRLTVRILDLRARDTMAWRVPANTPAGATSPGSLRAGVEYAVTVSGTWDNGSGVTSDAECARSPYNGSWRRDRFEVRVSGLDTDHPTPRPEDVSGEPVTDTGERCAARDHTYTFRWRSRDSEPLNVRVQDDGKYGDNTGSLRVQVTPYTEPVRPDEPEAPWTPAPRTETVEVDARSSAGVRTSQAYPAGTRLRLTATGVYLMREAPWDWIAADAECTVTSRDRSWRTNRHDGRFNGSRQPLGDVAVNGSVDEWRPSDGAGGCDEERHTYTRDVTTGRAGPLWLVVADDDYTDNSGSVRVTVEAR